MSDLNSDIRDAIGLISLLLVFVVAYLSAVWPQATTLLAEPIPDVKKEKERLVERLRSYQWLLVALAVLVVVVLALLAPLTARVLAAVAWGRPYDTLRAGLLLAVLLLTLIFAVAVCVWWRFRERINEVTAKLS